MKPLKLKLKNFGPYIDETVDFTNFEDSSLFLISGKTGAGKTTIFDGMSYALFGESSGKLRQGKELRSTFADPSEPTEIQLLFSHGEFLYEITRKPEQELFKKRGEGTRTQPAKISLMIKNPDGKEIKEYTKRREVDSFVQDLLHLDAEQFSQIILLPQGEFRTFLIANSGDKEKVLRRLFSTQMYQALSEELKQQSKAKNQEIDQIRQKIELKLEQIYWEQPLDSEDELVEKKLQLLTQQQEAFEEEQGQLKVKIDQLKDELKEIEQKKVKIEEQQNLSQQYQELLEKQENLLLQENEIKQLKQQEQELLWVKTQENLLESIDENEHEYQEQQNRLTASNLEREKVSNSLKEHQSLAAVLADSKKEMDEKYEQLTELTMKLPLYEEKAALEKALNTEELAHLAKTLNMEQQKKEQLIQQHEQLQQQLADQPNVEKKQLIVEQKQKDWEKIAANWRALSDDEEKYRSEQETLISLEQQLATANEQKKETEKQKKEAQAIWAKLQIIRLSLLLEEGEPCPVCGALEHPKQSEHQPVSLEEIQAAEQKLNEGEATLKKAEETVTKLAKDSEAVQKQSKQLKETLRAQREKLLKEIEESSPKQELVPDKLDDDWIEQEIQFVHEALSEIAETLEKLNNRQADEAALKEQLEQQQQLLSTLQKSYEEQSVSQQAVQIKLETIAKQLDEQLTYSEALEKRQRLEQERTEWLQKSEEVENKLLEFKEQEQQLIQEIKHLEQSMHKTSQTLEANKAKIKRSLEENNFSYDLEEINGLVERLSELTDIQSRIRAFEEQTKELAIRIQTTKEKLETVQLPELTEIDQQLEMKQQEIAEQESVYYRKKEKQADNAVIFQEITAAIQAVEKKWEEVAALQQLADTINGDNPKKTSLERYVLQTYLREVLKTANVRMASLTNSRYQFELNSEKNSYKNQTGLEINIYDDNAGASRSARTLSGGESFIAALALALSLAEVIQEQAGGVLIEALFIDEGFGSLDEEALEMAIEALETIENEGRMIGIISHVAELKSRISQQLQIKTNGAGQSSVSYQVM